MTYFHPIHSKLHKKKTHICVLCYKRLRLQNTSNTIAHLKDHKVDHTKPLLRKRSLHNALEAAFKRGGVPKDPADEEDKITKYIHELLAQFCFGRLMPYSMVEWNQLTALVKDCILLPPMNVSDRYSFD